MFKASTTYTYEYKSSATNNIKICKERLSLCANMTGYHKLKPVVIGNWENLVIKQLYTQIKCFNGSGCLDEYFEYKSL